VFKHISAQQKLEQAPEVIDPRFAVDIDAAPDATK
jgi:hypothetical protein